MASMHEYERWKEQRGNSSSQLLEWLRNDPLATAPADQTLAWIILGASCLTVVAVIYGLIRYRSVPTQAPADQGGTALALRFFFNVAIAPLLLGAFLVGAIIALKAIGVIG